MNLKEALAKNKLKEFAKEHEIKPGERHPQAQQRFDGLMDAMIPKSAQPPVPKPTKPKR